MVELVHYQDGGTLPTDDDHGSTEVLDSVMTAESGNYSAPRHFKEVFMAGHPLEIPMSQAPDIHDGKKPCVTSPPIPRHLPKKLMNRRQLGKGRTEHDRHDRLDVTDDQI
jgi:hypothetical protein